MRTLRQTVAVLWAVCWLSRSQCQPYDEEFAEYSFPEAMGLCEKPWRPVLGLDSSGSVTNGAIDDVRTLSLQGHVFRVKLQLPDGPYLLNVDNTNVRGKHVCGESLWHLSDNGTFIDSDASWRFHLLCTNGVVEVLTSPYSRPSGWSLPPTATLYQRRVDAALNFGSISQGLQAMVWYVKEIGDGRPVYSHYLDGSLVSGDVRDLVFMCGRGQTRAVMRDRGYAFTMNTVVIDEAASEVNGQSVSHVAQSLVDGNLTFRSPPYFWYSSWSTSGSRDCARWFVGTTQRGRHTNDNVALDWHVDSCWREVYSNDEDGFERSGSLDELIFYISLGHRVLVQYNTTVLEANLLRIQGRTVIAQSVEEMKRRGGSGKDKYFFNTQTLWQWTLVHSSGQVRVNTYQVQDMSRMHSHRHNMAVRWLVDTRPWRRLYSTPPGPYDDPLVLFDSVRRGASVRFGIQQDTSSGFLFTNADNVRLDEASQVVYAQCLRHVSDVKDNAYPNHYDFQFDPFHWFVMISSEGVMAMAGWKTQSREQMYEKLAPEPSIRWFISR